MYFASKVGEKERDDPSEEETSALLARVTELRDLAARLCSKVSEWASVKKLEGAAKLRRRIQAEEIFLSSLVSRGTAIRPAHVAGTNLKHANAVTWVASLVPGLEALGRRVGGGERASSRRISGSSTVTSAATTSSTVDVVACGGRLWVKVSARAAASLDAVLCGDCEPGKKTIAESCRELCAHAAKCRVGYDAPSVVCVLTNGATPAVRQELESLGVVVLADTGHTKELAIKLRALTPVYSSIRHDDTASTTTTTAATTTTSSGAEAAAAGASSSSTSSTSDTERNTGMNNLAGMNVTPEHVVDVSRPLANIDVTSMIILISDITHGHAVDPSKYRDPVLQQVAKLESAVPVARSLRVFLSGRRMIACRTAVDQLKSIVSQVAGPRERQRALELMDAIAVVPDVLPTVCEALKTSHRVKARAKVVFGTGLAHRAVTVTSNQAILRSARKQGIEFDAFVHDARALTESHVMQTHRRIADLTGIPGGAVIDINATPLPTNPAPPPGELREPRSHGREEQEEEKEVGANFGGAAHADANEPGDYSAAVESGGSSVSRSTSSKQAGDSLLSFCRRLPKVELHAHLNGSVSHATLVSLLEARGAAGSIDAEYIRHATSISSNDSRSLAECFELFGVVHSLVDTPAAVKAVAEAVVSDFAADGVAYLELRTTPRSNADVGMTKADYVSAVVAGVRAAENKINADAKVEGVAASSPTGSTTTSDCGSNFGNFGGGGGGGIVVRLLLSINRANGVPEAEENVDLAIAATQRPNNYGGAVAVSGAPYVVGVDLSGNPAVGHAADYIAPLARARQAGLKTAVHVAELDNPIDTALLMATRPDRIGHATTMDHTRARSAAGAPVEACITSNLRCKTVTSARSHHFGPLFRAGRPVVLCTDDKGVFGSSLSQEYALAAGAFGLDGYHLWKIARDAVEYIFAREEVKSRLRGLFHAVSREALVADIWPRWTFNVLPRGMRPK